MKYYSKSKPTLQDILAKASTEQRCYIDDTDPISHTRLLATAGSGKTFSIIARGWNMIACETARPEELAVLTFSRQARHDFVRKVQDMGAPLLARNIRTIDSFARQAIDPDGRIDMSILSYTLLQFLLTSAPEEVRAAPGMEHLHHIFVDEAQDLNSTQYSLVMAMAEKLGVGISLVGDPNQNIYQFRGGSDVYIRNFPAARTYMLTYNYRSFRHIVEYASHLRPYQDGVVNWTREAVHEGARVVMHVHDRTDTFEKALLAVIGRLRDRGVPFHKMAVLAPTRGSLSPDGRHKGLCHVANILATAAVPATQLYDDSGGLDISFAEGSRPVNEQQDHVTLMTYTACKGLEWDYVMLVDANAYLVSRADYTPDQFAAEQYLLYVAATRAKKALHVFVKRGHANPWLARVPCDLYHVAGNPERLSFADPHVLRFVHIQDDVGPLFLPEDDNPSDNPSDVVSNCGSDDSVNVNIDTSNGGSISACVYSLGEEDLYAVDTRFNWSVTCTEPMTPTVAEVPTGRKRFIARLARLAFFDAYNAELGKAPERMLQLEAVLDGDRVIPCDSPFAAQWHLRNKTCGWDAYNELKNTGRISKSVSDVLDKLDQNICMHEYTIVSDRFYHTHVSSRLTEIRSAYTSYLERRDQSDPGHTQIHDSDYDAVELARVKAIFQLAALEYALVTTHYFYSCSIEAAFGACSTDANIHHLLNLRRAATRIAQYYPERGPNIVYTHPTTGRTLRGAIDMVDPTGRGLVVQFASSLRLQDVLCAACHQTLSPTRNGVRLEFAIFNLMIGALLTFTGTLPTKLLIQLLSSRK